MSDNITIKDLLDLQEKLFAGQSGITLEATIKEVRQAYERKVKSGERAGETFYSQKLTIDDGTGSIVVDFIASTEMDAIDRTQVGRRVRVENAKTDIYKGERRLARGKLTSLDKEKPSSGPGVSDKQEEREYWDGKQKRQGREISRIALAKSLIEAGRKWGNAAQKEADGWFEWVMDGVEIKEGYEAVKEASKDIVKGSKALQKKVIEKTQEEPNEIAQDKGEVEKETPQRAALRKTFHSLKGQLDKMGFWSEEDYRNWLDDEFEVPSSSYLDDKEMERGIKILAGWLNTELDKKKEAKNASD